VPLGKLNVDDVDMLTVVVVGSSDSRTVDDRRRQALGLHAARLFREGRDMSKSDGRAAMTVYFIGAGPGAPDLITVRGLRLIERCPVCLYAGSLVPEEIVQAAPATRWSWTPRRCISTRSSRR
jgi:hypothetical protein